jgi:hypothetical protein
LEIDEAVAKFWADVVVCSQNEKIQLVVLLGMITVTLCATSY